MAYYWPIPAQMTLAIHHYDDPTYIIIRPIYDNVNIYPSIKKIVFLNCIGMITLKHGQS